MKRNTRGISISATISAPPLHDENSANPHRMKRPVEVYISRQRGLLYTKLVVGAVLAVGLFVRTFPGGKHGKIDESQKRHAERTTHQGGVSPALPQSFL